MRVLTRAPELALTTAAGRFACSRVTVVRVEDKSVVTVWLTRDAVVPLKATIRSAGGKPQLTWELTAFDPAW